MMKLTRKCEPHKLFKVRDGNAPGKLSFDLEDKHGWDLLQRGGVLWEFEAEHGTGYCVVKDGIVVHGVMEQHYFVA